jgi:hypothetical protein
MSTGIDAYVRPTKFLAGRFPTFQKLDLFTAIRRSGQGFEQGLSSHWTIFTSIFVIGMVAAMDTYLTLKYAHTLPQLERNPIGRWLMCLDTGPVCDLQQIAAFVTAKFVGTMLVIGTIQLLARWRAHLAGTIGLALAGFQIGLAFHLLFGLD